MITKRNGKKEMKISNVSSKTSSRRVKKDFSIVEDRPGRLNALRSLGSRTGRVAAQEAKAAGIAVTYMDSRGKLINIHPDGTRSTAKSKLIAKRYFYKKQPGTVYHAPKK